MCGIGGVIYRDRRQPDVRALDRMSEAMRDRGPDDQGLFTGPGIGLVHRRLSIIDLTEAGRGPMPSHNNMVQLVQNGEIYNFQELRKDLESSGYRFLSTCDSEVIINGYLEWGESVVERLEGMFAFGIWDNRKEKLLLARDRMGEKPLYVRETSNGFFFASTLNAISAFFDGALEVDSGALDCFLSHCFIPGPHTIWTGVNVLPPANIITIGRNGIENNRQYWSFTGIREKSLSVEESTELIINSLESSVRKRLVADVPVGGFLSGGVDSSLVMALAARNKPQIKTFTVGYDFSEFSELKYAKMVARAIGSEHNELIVGENDLLNVIPELVWQYGQPFGDASAIPTNIISRFARQSVTVSLSGDGGDESFAGYWRVAASWYAEIYRKIVPSIIRKSFINNTLKQGRLKDYWLFSRLWSLNQLSLNSPGAGYNNNATWLNYKDSGYGSRLKDDLLCGISRNHNPISCRTGSKIEDTSISSVRQVLLDDYKVLLPFCYLVKVDVASMACSLEVRTPFLDHHYVENAWALPDAMKLRLGRRKWLLKKIAAKYVPREVIYRPKKGFALPLVHWWKGKLAKTLNRLMVDSRCIQWGWIEKSAVKRCLEEHNRGIVNHDVRLWCVLWLELWARIVVEHSMSPRSTLLDYR